MTIDPNEFLLGAGGIPAKFENIGDTITGTIAEAPVVRQQTDIETGRPLFWDDGNPRMQLVVTLSTALRDNTVEGDDGTRRVYVKAAMRQAIATAVRAVGGNGLEVGGTLSVRFTGTEASKTRGFNPTKLYAASYTRPPAGGDFLGVGAQPGQLSIVPPPPDPVVQQQPPASPTPPPTMDPALAAALSNLSPEAIAALTAQAGNSAPPF